MASSNVNVLSAIEETVGVVKSGNVTIITALNRSKKSFYGVLSERAFEFYESEKTYRKKKTIKFVIDLTLIFNVHTDHLDLKLKRCICIMTQSDTICVKGESESQTAEWFASLMSVVVPARALKLGRPVMHREFFECAWDVEISPNPKLKRPPKPDDPPLINFASKRPEFIGTMRLCFYPHTIILAQRKAEPTNVGCPVSGFPPFRQETFVELSRHFIPFYGFYEKYFLLKIGRGSPLGACELWAACESEEIAFDMHSKLQQIIERERDKRKIMAESNAPLPGITASAPPSRSAHRERSHTNATRLRVGSINGNPTRVGSPASLCSLSGRKPSSSSLTGRPTFTGPSSNDNSSPCGSMASVFHQSCRSSCIEEETGIYQPMETVRRPVVPIPTASSSSGTSLPLQRHERDMQIYTQYQRSLRQTSPILGLGFATGDETEDSGGTLRLEGTVSEGHPSPKQGRTLHGISEARRNSKDMWSSDGDELSSMGGSSSIGGSSSHGMAGSIGGISANEADIRQPTYTLMEAADWSNNGSTGHLAVPNTMSLSEREKYNLEEVRSYVSDSSDSCYSSMAAASTAINNPPRAYSFGGRSAHVKAASAVTADSQSVIDSGGSLDSKPQDPACSSIAGNSQDDPRKRAFSLGNKGLLTELRKPFRKISQHATRTRQPHVSQSGGSLGSSAASFGPASASSNQLSTNNMDTGEYVRNRSGSFGSGRSTPYSKRGNVPDNHLVEMDFGTSGALGRSGSGSVASVDSSCRSRTSSFGCAVHKGNELLVEEEAPVLAKQLEEIGMTAMPKPAATGGKQLAARANEQAKQKFAAENIAKSLEPTISESDYVVTESSDFKKKAKAYISEPTTSANSSKSTEVRASQLFETIEESASGKSSRASSSPDYEMYEAASSSTLMPSTCSSTSLLKRSSVPSPSLPEQNYAALDPPPSAPPIRQSVQDDSHLDYACLVPASSPSSAASKLRSRSGILSGAGGQHDSNSSSATADYTAVQPL